MRDAGRGTAVFAAGAAFYAAPGKYELEFSGPGITTKQLPNVILPSDPSAPTFSSLATTGSMSAFSLNLAGDLTVSGNSSVTGSLASGTFNLSNQGSAPGAADTGTEIGALASDSGAQTKIANTFTAPQNIDADFHTKGPNPVYDLTRRE